MSDPLKAALILGAAIVIAMSIWVYFSPYHSCVRAMPEKAGPADAAAFCARSLAGN